MVGFAFFLTVGLFVISAPMLIGADVPACVTKIENGLVLSTCDAGVQVVAESSNDLKLEFTGQPTEDDELKLTIFNCTFTVQATGGPTPKFEVVNGPSDDGSLKLKLTDNAITQVGGEQTQVQCTGGPSILKNLVNGKKQVTLIIKQGGNKGYNVLLKGTGITTDLSASAEQPGTTSDQAAGGNLESLKAHIQFFKICFCLFAFGWGFSVLVASTIIAYISIKVVLNGRGYIFRLWSKKRGKKDKKETKIEFSKVKFSKVKKPKKSKSKKKDAKAPKERAVRKAN
ncbi:hypothetical protein M3Y98_00725800 [Aphelenchoides besseyi]|nr:hypothetical protein M3Y98_00725800 [Aphelenchoides besseyi]KAI6210193.1 hypothetical protein M3Y96_00301700 [Aphelenchoides besseyi]